MKLASVVASILHLGSVCCSSIPPDNSTSLDDPWTDRIIPEPNRKCPGKMLCGKKVMHPGWKDEPRWGGHCGPREGEKIQSCKVHAEQATVFYWPTITSGTPAETSLAARRRLSRATYSGLEVVSPSVLLIVSSIHASVLPTAAAQNMLKSAGLNLELNPGERLPKDLEDAIPSSAWRPCLPIRPTYMERAITHLIDEEDLSTIRYKVTAMPTIPPSSTSRAHATRTQPITAYITASQLYPLKYSDLWPIGQGSFEQVWGAFGCDRDEMWRLGYKNVFGLAGRRCPTKVDPEYYTPVLALPTQAMKSMGEMLEGCEAGAVMVAGQTGPRGAITYVPITERQLEMPTKVPGDPWP
jgi:hypothetical protein